MLILAAVDLRLIVAVTVFLAVVSMVWFAMDVFNRDDKAAAESRLDMMNVSMRILYMECIDQEQPFRRRV